MIKLNHIKILHQIHARLHGTQINWVITGSLSFALQGLDVDVHDIDLQTDSTGAYEIARLFAEHISKPVRFLSSDRIRSHFGALEIEGIPVEIMGDIRKRGADGSWEDPVDIERYKQWVNFDGLDLPVLSLEYEYQAYLQLGRTEKADMLRRWLQGQSAILNDAT
jgi:hypothetical protein